MTPEAIDRYIAGIPEQERRHWRQLHRQCQRCGSKVGSANLGVCIWPPPARSPKSRRGSDSGRYGMGRARLCAECVTVTEAPVRVPASTWEKAPQPVKRSRSGRSIIVGKVAISGDGD
jgi:hypothetical protein